MALPQPQPRGSALLRLFLELLLLLLAAAPAINTNITITDTFVSVTAGAPPETPARTAARGEGTPTTAALRVLESAENTTASKQVEYGICTVTCGIGIREVILTSGCPGAESKCLVRVEECRGPSDCGWGKPISESLESMKMGCIYIPPENRFTYVWKMLIPDQQSLILPNDSAILEVHRKTHPVAFQCDTKEHNNLVASVKYTVYTTAELELRRMEKPNTDVLLTFVLIAGVIVVIGVILAIIFITLNWASVKSFWQTKFWKTEDQGSSQGSLRAFDESPGNPTTGEASQTSQLDVGQEGISTSYQEWNTEGGKESF